MYESTVDVLYNLYDKLSIGGYVIMDDWAGFPLKVTCKDFFAVHGTNHESISNYSLAVYKKIEQVLDMKYWRYKHNQQNF